MSSTDIPKPDSTWTRNDGSIVPGYAFGPENAKRGLIVIQEWWGITPQILDQAKYLSESCGCKCLVPDIYRGKIGVDFEEASHLMDNLDFVAAVEDLRGAARYLKEEKGVSKIGVIGFCMGGALSLAVGALAKEYVDCVVSFYGTPAAELCNLETITVPVNAHFGDKDGMVGFSDPIAVDKLKGQLAKSGVDFNVYSYESVGHAFMNNREDQRKKVEGLGFGDYKEDVAAVAWARTKVFFAKHLD